MSGITPLLARATVTTTRPPRPLALPAPLQVPQALLSLGLFGTALTSALLLYLCYFPVSCGALAWIALVPFLLLVRSRMGNPFRYFTALVVGLAFYWPVLSWVRVADERMLVAWWFLATYCAIYFPLGLFLVRWIDRATCVPLVLSVPVVWTALEYFRATFCTGFSYYLLGYAQHDYLPVIQIADITGVYGVTFLLAGVNALIAELLYSWARFRRVIAGPDAPARYGIRGVVIQAIGAIAVLLATLGYGFWQMSGDDYRPGPRVALIQGNLDQRIRNDAQNAEDAGKKMLLHYESLAVLAGSKDYHPDLIVWPETSYPKEWVMDADGGLRLDNFKDAVAITNEARTNHLLGVNLWEDRADGTPWRYNSAVLLTPQGEMAGRYDKIHRVVFGEYIPLRDWIPWMNKLSPYDFDYSIHPGAGPTRFAMREQGGDRRAFTFGVVICYEDTDPDMARPYGGSDGKSAADFILNISNDGWFNGSSEHEEHLAICRFRAVECRRSVARSVNMGISAVIDANGRVLQPDLLGIAQPVGYVMAPEDCPRVWDISPQSEGKTSLPVSKWHEFKKVQGVLLATIPLDNRTSFYANWGHWLPGLCWVLLAPALAVMVWRVVTSIARFMGRLTQRVCVRRLT
jgi:apolipoprotein N-acyltransferase